MSLIDKFVTMVGLVASVAAASLWLWGSLIDVPDNIDTIVRELQRIGRVNAWAAIAALVAALCRLCVLATTKLRSPAERFHTGFPKMTTALTADKTAGWSSWG
jgi:hypothetical protein